MTSKPAGLGEEEAPKYKPTWERHDLPTTRKDLLLAVEAILKPGGVQKMVIELGKPIRVRRLVPEGEMPEVPSDLIDDDIYAAARNAEIGNVPKDASPLSQLFRAFSVLSAKGAKPRAFLVPQHKQFFSWLQTEPSRVVFGVDVIEHKGIPDETALLVGAQPDDEEVIIFSARFELDVPSVKERYEADRRKDAQ